MNWNKYEPEVTVEQQNRYLDFLINLGFQGVNRLLVLSFENNGGRRSYRRYNRPLVEVKNYIAVTDGWKLFDQQVKHNLITHDNTSKYYNCWRSWLHKWLSIRLKLL